MQVAVRRLIVVGAISLGGTVAGLALGNFAAGGTRMSGEQELAVYRSFFGEGDATASVEDEADTSVAMRDGPSSYTCQGCDAKLYSDTVSADASIAATEPLPPYVPEEAVMPPPPAHPSATRPAASATGYYAVPALPPVLAADRARIAPVAPPTPSPVAITER